MKAAIIRLCATFSSLACAISEGPIDFDTSEFFSHFAYEGMHIKRPRITSIDRQGVTLIEVNVDGEFAVTIPLERAIKYPELKMKAGKAIRAVMADPTLAFTTEKVRKPLAEASATSERELTRLQRGKLVAEVRRAGLLIPGTDPSELSDSELLSLHQRALPILEMKALREDLKWQAQ